MLTEDEATLLVALLEKMTWPVPLKVFYALCAKTIMSGVDLALIRRNGWNPEILLTQRPLDDPYFSGLWHLPGGMVMPGKTGLDTIAERALKADINVQLSGELEFIMVRDIPMGLPGLHSSPRGQELYRLYRYQLRDNDPAIEECETRRFFPLDKVPDAFIQHQLPSITILREMYGV